MIASVTFDRRQDKLTQDTSMETAWAGYSRQEDLLARIGIGLYEYLEIGNMGFGVRIGIIDRISILYHIFVLKEYQNQKLRILRILIIILPKYITVLYYRNYDVTRWYSENLKLIKYAEHIAILWRLFYYLVTTM